MRFGVVLKVSVGFVRLRQRGYAIRGHIPNGLDAKNVSVAWGSRTAFVGGPKSGSACGLGEMMARSLQIRRGY